MEVVVHPTPNDVAAAVAAMVVDTANAAGERFTLGLAGGSTPKPVYEILLNSDVMWDSVAAWMTDERWVPHDSERNNGRMAIETLFGRVPATLLRPEFEPGMDPEESAQHYETQLKGLFGNDKPDMAVLGMGDDGHTASLFPGSDALGITDRWYVANTIPETKEPRLTATYPLLYEIDRIAFIVVGENKAEALRDSLSGESPAGRVGNGDNEVVWHVDKAAANLL